MQTYTFKYQNTKGGLLLLLGVIGAPFLVMVPSILLLSELPWIFWVSIPLMLGIMVCCIIRFSKLSQSIDTITVDALGFTSKDYGRILYTDIASIPPYNLLQAPPPSMRIRLKNGKKIAWNFNPQNTKLAKDIATFTLFREALLLEFIQMLPTEKGPEQPTTSTNAGTNAQPSTDPLHPKNESPAKTISPAEQSELSEEIITQLKRQKKRDHKYITIPISAAFGLILFFKTCGADYIHHEREKEMNVIRTGAAQSETDYQTNIKLAQAAVDTYTQKFGPVYLFTNDSAADLRFIPMLDEDNSPQPNIIGIRRLEDNKKLEGLIRHPDSVTYRMVLHHPGSRQFIQMEKSVFAKDDSSQATLYLCVYNDRQSLFDSALTPGDPEFRPIQFSSSIPLPKAGSLKKADLKDMNYASIRSILLRYEHSLFYMAAKQQDSITVARFEQVKNLISLDLQEHGIPTNSFKVKTFNTAL